MWEVQAWLCRRCQNTDDAAAAAADVDVDDTDDTGGPVNHLPMAF